MTSMTSTKAAVQQQIVTLVDPDAPAKRVRTTAEVVARLTRHTVTREPVIDEVTGEAVWVGDDLLVTVPVERLNDFRAWVATGGSAPCGRGSYTVESLTREDPSFRRVIEAVRA